MTIFHVLKYPITDVREQCQLDLLPAEVVTKWRRRMEDYAIDAAKSVMHLDKTGTAQKAIDAIYLFRDGKISRDELRATAYYAIDAADNAANVAYYAAASAAHAAYYAAHAAYYAAVTDAGDWDKSRRESLALFKKWLIEELNNYEEVICQDIH